MRPIVVAGWRLRWRFADDLVVVPADRSGPVLRVDWGWRDWLEPGPVGPEPWVVTPRFVAEAIGSALSQGWDPSVNGPALRLRYQSGQFVAEGTRGASGPGEGPPGADAVGG